MRFISAQFMTKDYMTIPARLINTLHFIERLDIRNIFQAQINDIITLKVQQYESDTAENSCTKHFLALK
jgi:hypothetical protein